MRSTRILTFLAVLGIVLATASNAAALPYSPPTQSGRFNGERILVTWGPDWGPPSTPGSENLLVEGYDGSLKLDGREGKPAPAQLVSVRWGFYIGDCPSEPEAGATMTIGYYEGSTFTGDAAIPVFDFETREIHATVFVVGGLYDFDCATGSWTPFQSASGTVTLDGYFDLKKCQGRGWAVCCFTGTVTLVEHRGAGDGIDHSAGFDGSGIGEAFADSYRGTVSWYATD